MSLKKSIAWKNFSKYIRLKYGPRCYTCGNIPKVLQAGHFVQGFGHQNTFFSERNVRPQCFRCNINLSGNGAEFARRLQEEFGLGIVKELTDEGRKYKQYAPKELKELAAYYKEKIKELNK